MYGKNKITHQNIRDDGLLAVHSIFPTIQGEGPDAGVPAVFVRLQGCNLRCWFCDTEFDTGSLRSSESIALEVLSAARRFKSGMTNPVGYHPGTLVVITGGEPFLQDFIPLVIHLNNAGLRVSVETAGTLYLEGALHRFHRCNIWGNMIVCSPKTPTINSDLVKIVWAWKYVVSKGDVDITDGLPIYATQDRDGPTDSRLFRRPSDNNAPIFVQPCDAGKDHELTEYNKQLARDICLNFGYRLSIQLHKIVDVP